MLRPLLKCFLIIIILFAGIVTDQQSKQWAAKNLKNQSTRVVIRNVLEFGYTENHGMVFGINNKHDNHFGKTMLQVVRILLSIGLSGYLIMNWKKNLLFHFPFLLILAGAIGNVIDSLRFGYVVDFIHMHLGTFLDWPFLYNLADAYVCIGMGMLIIQSFIGDRKPPLFSISPQSENES